MNPLKSKLWFGVAIFALLLGACSPAAATDSAPTPDAAAIATSAVMTVEARYTQQAAEAASQPTQTPTSTPKAAAELPTITPTTTAAPLPQPTSGADNGKPCLYASFITDLSIPDGMLMDPGDTFTKTWRVQNKGTCTWDSTYSLVFWSGDNLAAATSYPLKQSVGPEQTADLSIPMTAPSAAGIYYGEWRLQTPWGGTMGFGPYDAPLSVKINANAKGNFNIASVDLSVVRDPQTGCPAKGVHYIVTAKVTANAAGTIQYHWDQHPTDGDPPTQGQLTFADAGTKSVTFEWVLKPDAVQDIQRWAAFVVDTPTAQEFGRAEFVFSCQ